MSEWDFPNAATPEGSGPYYVVRFSPESDHQRLAAIFAWFHHQDDMVAKAKDPGVARLKLDWWREEISHFNSGELRHPLSQALAKHCQQEWQQSLLSTSLHDTERRILKQQPESSAQLDLACQQSGGALAQLLCNRSANEAPHAQQLGNLWALLKRLKQQQNDIHQGQIWLPQDQMLAHNLSKASLEQGQHSEAFEKIVESLLLHAIQLSQEAIEAARKQPKNYAPALRLAAQAMASSRKIQKDGYRLLDTHYELSPIRLLWSAWRMKG